ncbi:hypothetical protein [Kordia sp.]|uniref:hypothetical protein n=1 Tax=Kordia sp. TaxID=1965332 RepID=UPI003B58B9B4
MPIKNKIWSCLVLSLLLFVGCKNDDYVEEQSESTGFVQKAGGSGYTLCGKTILKFNTLDQVQNTHRNLYENYHTSGEDEDVLIAYEMSKGLYSLRKKEQDMDEGIIPDDPDFDTFDYTFDTVFESMLNQDGMIIIEDYLYLWSDGCVVVRIKPPNCKNYKALLNLQELVKRGQLKDRDISYYVNELGVEMINICDDPRFDFESISETGTHVDNSADYSGDERGMECGFQPVVSWEILDHNDDEKTIKLRIDAHSIAPIGSDPIYFTYLDNADTFTSVTIKENSLGLPESIWGDNFYGYPGEWFVVEIDYTDSDTAPIANFRLYGAVYLLTPNSCSGEDTLDINLECPIGISKNPVDADSGLWEFSVEGLDHLTESYSIEWTFAGAGTTTTLIVYDASGANNTFPVPCESMNFGFSAFINSSEVICKNQLSGNLDSGGYCTRGDISIASPKGVKLDGKRIRCKTKLKKRADIFGGQTIAKSKIKHRKKVIRSINSSGSLLMISGLDCVPVDIASILPPVSQPEATKKKLKQKANAGFARLNLAEPYSVNFTTSSGYSHTLTYFFPCSE